MKYSPRRDIPKAVRDLQTLSPTEIVEWIKNHRTEKDRNGKRIQVIRKTHSISMFFQRNPAIYRQLKEEIEELEVNEAQVREMDFQNGNFRKIACIDRWILELRGRPATEEAITNFVGAIKQICKGELPRSKQEVREKKPVEILEEWGLKHPQALTLEDCLRYNSELVKRKKLGRRHRLAMRNFLKSRNVRGWDSISGRLEKQKGQYAHLYIPKPKVNKCFEWLKPFNEEIYLMVKFSFKCGGGRLTATHEAEAQYVDEENKTIWIFEKANRNSPKRKVLKEIPDDFYTELEPRIKRGGRLFNIEKEKVAPILRACYKAVIPKLEPNIPMPFHFWRHQFAQHLLRATGWNYALVAEMGGWKVQTLEDYYGAMDRKEITPYAREKMQTL